MAHIQQKTKPATIKFTPDQYRRIDQRAKKCGVRISTWMRSILLQAVSRHPTEDGYLPRIKEPNETTI